MGLCMMMLSDRDDPFMLMLSMMLTEFRCPQLPMVGQLAEDGSSTVINSHDLMATFVARRFATQTRPRTVCATRSKRP